MIQRKRTFFLGIFIFVLPFLGLPSFWKTLFIVASGIVLMVLSVKISLPRKYNKTKNRKEKITQVFVESAPIYPKDDTVEKSNMRAEEIQSSDIQ